MAILNILRIRGQSPDHAPQSQVLVSPVASLVSGFPGLPVHAYVPQKVDATAFFFLYK